MAAVAPDLSLAQASRFRKLHSLSGVVPVGAFLVFHIWITLSIVGARETYDRQMAVLHGGPLLGLLEVVLVLIPLGYHGIYGIYRSLQPRVQDHGFESPLMQALQRASGAIILVFVVAHVCEFRAQTWTSGLAVGSYSTKLVADLSSTQSGVPLYALGYLIGIAATVFHLVNGLTSFLTTWGVAPDRRMRVFFRIVGALLFALSAAIVLQIATGTRIFPAEPPKTSGMLCGSAVPPPPPPPPAPPPSSSALPLPPR